MEHDARSRCRPEPTCAFRPIHCVLRPQFLVPCAMVRSDGECRWNARSDEHASSSPAADGPCAGTLFPASLRRVRSKPRAGRAEAAKSAAPLLETQVWASPGSAPTHRRLCRVLGGTIRSLVGSYTSPPTARHVRRALDTRILGSCRVPSARAPRAPARRLLSSSPIMSDARATTSSRTSGLRSLRCGERPVLLVHGFLATPRVVSGLAARFARSGYCAHGVDLGGLFGRFNARPVGELARVVAERVEQLARDHRCEQIELVGHSEGGLIGRYYVQKLDGARRVRHLVTLGTPHRGTPWAYSGYLVRGVLPSLRQMAPGSALLRDLADHRFPDGVRLTSVYSQGDPFCPPWSCRLEVRRGARLKNVELANGGHLDFLFSARIFSIICRELESLEPPSSAGDRFGASHRPPVVATVEERTSSAACAA